MIVPASLSSKSVKELKKLLLFTLNFFQMKSLMSVYRFSLSPGIVSCIFLVCAYYVSGIDTKAIELKLTFIFIVFSCVMSRLFYELAV